MITAKELRNWLSRMPAEAVIVVARDHEGNDFRPLNEIELGKYDESLACNLRFDSLNREGHLAVCLYPKAEKGE